MSKRTEIRVPDIGDFDKVPVIEVLVAEGDAIEAEQSLVTLESDKATMEVPSPAAGKLVKLSVKEGDEVSEGDVIGEMELDDDAADEGAGSNDGGNDERSGSTSEEREADDSGSAPAAGPDGGSDDGSTGGDDGAGDGGSETIEIRVPDIGDFDKVPVIEVLVEKGETVEAEQSLLTLESDKATMDIPAPESGTILELEVGVGDEVSEGDVIGRMKVSKSSGAGEDTGSERDEASDGSSRSEGSRSDESAPKESHAPKSSGSDASSEGSAAGSSGDGELKPPPVPFAEMGRDPSSIPHASPAVRKLARELGVDLAGVKGSGAHGRITESDLKQHVKATMQGDGGRGTASSGSGLAVADAPKVDFAKFGEIEEKPLSRIQKISGPNLHRNWVSIPHVTQFDEADITEMDAFRKASKADAEAAGTKMTPLVFLIKAVVAGLKKYPKFNTSLSADGQSLVWKKYFHVGVAVDTPNGLMVPVIRDADSKSLLDLAHDLTELSGKARDGKLSRDEMTGGCFSISSLGGIGGTAFTPIINAPEVAILGVSKAETKPVWNGETFEPRLMLPLSLSYDHRVIDGADAARFTQYLAHVLGDIRRLIL
ncbi:dihydrolipoyllysine-residue acetyltransferase [Halomonas denitrificans]|nr:dihydrolipoyllysine-residue acetyltransferase [Halomonas denitrificans]